MEEPGDTLITEGGQRHWGLSGCLDEPQSLVVSMPGWSPGTPPVPSPHLHLLKLKVSRGRCWCYKLSVRALNPPLQAPEYGHPYSAPCASPGFSLCGQTWSKQLNLALIRAVTSRAVSPIDSQPHGPISHLGFSRFWYYNRKGSTSLQSWAGLAVCPSAPWPGTLCPCRSLLPVSPALSPLLALHVPTPGCSHCHHPSPHCWGPLLPAEAWPWCQ